MRRVNGRRRAIWLARIYLVSALCTATQGWCADSTNAVNSMLDLFIKKGFITEQEAEKVQAEAQALGTNEAQMPPLGSSVWKINKALKSVELFGDVRGRYEDRSARDAGGNQIDLQRFRYAVRVGLRGDLFDGFYYGVRLDTGANPRSPWVTVGTSSSSSSVYQGPFGKSNAGLNVGLGYLGWQPSSWVDLTIGKMPNPLYSTPMVWDSDIAPEGFSERFKGTVGPVQFFANFGQFLYADFNPNSFPGNMGINGALGQRTDNIFLLAWQGGLNYQITTNLSATVGATLYNYVGAHQSTQNTFGSMSPYFGDPYIGEGAYYLEGGSLAPGYGGYGLSSTLPGYGSLNYPLNQVGINHLEIVEIPFEINYRVGRVDTKLFGDFAYNLQGGQRAEDAVNAYQAVQRFQTSPLPLLHTVPLQKSEVKAYQVGLDLASRDSSGMVYGTTSRRHGWELRSYWQHVEQYALDPNLLDSDFFEGRGNLQGVYVALAYGLTGNVIATFRYGHAWRINDQLGTGGSNQDLPWINPINQYNIFQVDFTFRF